MRTEICKTCNGRTPHDREPCGKICRNCGAVKAYRRSIAREARNAANAKIEARMRAEGVF